jgi:hypothetical protein
MSPDTVRFQGKISSTTPDGRSAIVKLNSSVEGRSFAVITPSSRGRIHAMNGVGKLERDVKVSGSASIGIDALNVVEFESI